MAPTALTVETRPAPSAAISGIESSAKQKQQLKPSDKQKSNVPPLALESGVERQRNNLGGINHPFHPGYKELTVSPGMLGLTLQFVNGEHIDMAVIMVIDPACIFKEKIQVGDCIVSIDGRELTKPNDLHVGKEKKRIFGIVPNTVPATNETALDKVPVGSLVAERNREAGNDAKVVGKRKRQKEDDAQHVVEAARKQVKTHIEKELHLQQKQQFSIFQLQATQQLMQSAQQLQAAQNDVYAAAEKRRCEINQFEIATQQLLEFGEFEKWLNGWTKYQQFLTNHYRTRHADGWEQRYQELIRFKHENEGDCNRIPLDYRDPDDLALGEWAELQRELYYEGKLDEERANCLTEQGFDFNFVLPKTSFTGDEHWDDKMKELIEYKKKHFTCDVPINYPVGESLGQWVQNQRDMYNEGTLDEERANYLTEQGVDFDLALPKIPFNGDELWDEKMQELIECKEKTLNCDVPINDPGGESLDLFVQNQIEEEKQWKPQSFCVPVCDIPGESGPREVDLVQFCPDKPDAHLQYGAPNKDKRLYFGPKLQRVPDIVNMMNNMSCIANKYSLASGNRKRDNRYIYCSCTGYGRKSKAITHTTSSSHAETKEETCGFKLIVKYEKKYNQWYMRQNAGHCLEHFGHIRRKEGSRQGTHGRKCIGRR